MSWLQIGVTYGLCMFIFVLGWFVCAALSIGREADREELDQ